MEQGEKSQQKFKGDLVEFLVHKKPACQLEFEVTAAPSLVKEAQKKAIREVAKQVTLPGFRKGRAPDELVLKNYAHDVDKKWQEAIADISFRESQKLANSPVLHGRPRISFTMKKHSLDGATLSLLFEVEPDVPSIDPKKITLTKVEKPKVDKEKVSETVRQVQMFFASWDKITDRSIRQGDFVVLDVESLETDPPSKAFSGVRFEVTEKSMAEWMRKLVIGKKKGDQIEGISEADDNATEEEKKQFEKRKVRLTILEAESCNLPELDADFAKKLGVETTEEVNKQIEMILNKKADESQHNQLKTQVSEKLLEEYSFDLPQSLIENETEFRVKQLFNDERFRTYWQQLAEDERKKSINSIYGQAERAIRMFYLCQKLVNDQKIEVMAKDMHEAPSTALEMLFSPRQEFQNDTEKHSSEAYSRLVLEKAEDFIVKNAELTDKPKEIPAPKKEVENKTAPKKETETKAKPTAKKKSGEKKTPEKKATGKKSTKKTESENEVKA